MSILKTGKYEMMDGSTKQSGVSCDDKVNEDKMTLEEYDSICKYIPGVEGSKFPQEVLQYLLTDISWRTSYFILLLN